MELYFDETLNAFREYVDTYDVTIHCESQEEHDDVLRIMHRFSADAPEEFEEGELVIYQNGDSFEIGRIKRIRGEQGAFVWYHEYDTAAATPFKNLHKIKNAYVIKDTLGKME